MRHTSTSRKVFVVCNTIFLVTMALLCILPLWNLLAISFSGKSAANSGAVTFWPIDFTPLAYVKTFNNNNFIRSMIIAFLRTSLGTLLSMFVITTAGYALSKEFRGRTPLMWFFVFTMLFGGGLIPSYMVNVSLGLKNNFLVYILPGAFGCYNLILIMNFFKSIPKSLEEAALIDGARDLPSALQSRSRNRSTVHHGWLLERVVHRNPLHVRYEKLSAGILPAGDRCAGKQSGSVAGSGICAGYVGTYH